MANFLNQVELIGNLGRDPEVHVGAKGRIVNLSIATSETWNDANSGEKRERTEWHRVVIYSDGLAGVVEEYLRKGSKVFIQGKLQARKWTDNAGVERYSTEIVLQPYNGKLIMLDSQRNGSGKSSSDKASGPDVGDDEIPF